MKYLKIILLFLSPLFATAQPLGTWPVQYGDTAPTHTPSGSGTRIYFNISTNDLWNWNPAPVSAWIKYPKGFDQISGCTAPAYTPTARQSVFGVNSCTVLQNGRGPELYQYTGSQWVCLNCYPAYTAGTGIGISSGVITNTAPDQVVSISGVGITPSGTYPNFTLTAADQSATNELQNLSLSGQSLGISSGTGVTLPVVGVTAGAGIGVSSSSGNFTVSNTGDLSDTNELQTLSIDGNELTLSDGGGTVEIPGGASDALGTGFTAGGGAGTIPGETKAGTSFNWGGIDLVQNLLFDQASYFQNTYADGYKGAGIEVYDENTGATWFLGSTEEDPTAMRIETSDGTNNAIYKFSATEATLLPNGRLSLSGSAPALSQAFEITVSGDGDASFTDNRTTKRGLVYSADYSATIITNPTSFTDVTSVNLLKQTPVSYTNAAAPNNCIFYSTTLSKLAYKDPGGTVNPLY